MHKFHPDLSVLFNLIGEFPVRHWDKVRKRGQRVVGMGGTIIALEMKSGSCVLCLDFGTEMVSYVTFETETIIAFKSHPKSP